MTEIPRGLRVRLRADGTANVPLAVEIAFRAGGALENCRAVPGVPDSFVLERGAAVYRVGAHAIRVGPGDAALPVRCEPELSGVARHTGDEPVARPAAEARRGAGRR